MATEHCPCGPYKVSGKRDIEPLLWSVLIVKNENADIFWHLVANGSETQGNLIEKEKFIFLNRMSGSWSKEKTGVVC